MTAAGGAGLPESTVRLVCTLIGVVALVAVLVAALASSDSGSAVGITTPSTAVSSSAIHGPTPTGSATGHSPGHGTSTSPLPTVSTTVPAQELTPAYVQAHFPFPPGSTPGRGPAVPGVRYMQVRAGLAEVKHFYDVSLPSLDGRWAHPSPTTSPSGVTTGWSGSVVFPTLLSFVPTLSIDDNYYGDQPGVVRIKVDFR